ncbi:kinase-like protein [Hymenopellis radicata]|nr:kinase-like protein [Hymenopellis radicata]
MILRKLTSPLPRGHAFADLDPLLPSPSMSPAPASPIPSSTSKTNAFFGSPFTSRPASPIAPSFSSKAETAANSNSKKPTRSLTADFFSLPAPASPVTPKISTKRNFLNLDLLCLDGGISSPIPTHFTSTPTPSTVEYPEYPSDLSSEPTPRPPALMLNLVHGPAPPTCPLFKFEPLASPVYPPSPLPGTREDAEVLPSSCHSSDYGHGNEDDEYELAPGMIIRSFLPGHTPTPSSPVATSPSSDTFSSSSSSSTLFPPSDSSWSNGASSASHEHSDVSLLLSRPLGSGAFSNVWLAEDLSSTPLLFKTKRSLRDLKQKSIGKLKESRSSSSLMRKLRGGVSGTRPHSNSTSSPPKKYQGLGLGVPTDMESEKDRVSSANSVRSLYLDEKDGDDDLGASLSRNCSISWKSQSSDSEGLSRSGSTRSRTGKPKLVAVKLTLRGSIENSSQGRIGEEEERERDRMRVSFVREVEVLKHISHPNITPLLSHLTTRTHHLLVLPYCPGGDLLGLVGSDLWDDLSESVVRRIWMELCRAVGWMHGVGLVHRDVKLENILLTTPLIEPLPIAPAPLIQLTDFGLSRFIDPTKPLLATRCGSEAYAAPELVINGGRSSVASGHSKWGDYSQDDEGGYDARETDAWACGVALYELVSRSLPFGDGPGGKRGGPGRDGGSHERRQWLIRIARAEWKWPEGAAAVDGEELRGKQLVKSAGVRRMVESLLVRDPSKRARVVDLWGDEWMKNEPYGVRVNVWRSSQRFEEPDEEEALENEVDEDGWIVDGDRIEDIARQEVH